MTKTTHYLKVVAALVTLAALAALTLAVVPHPALAQAQQALFKLGKTNPVTALSTLKGNLNSAILRLDNDGNGAKATALKLLVEPGKAPMTVNSETKVARLNADKIDDRNANELVRVASFTGPSPLANGASGTAAATKITAPAPGFLVIDGGSDLVNRNESGLVICKIEVNNVFARGSLRFMELDGAADVNQDEDCSTNTVVPVAAGTHTVDLEGISDDVSTEWEDTALSAIYIPFDGAGASPSSAAVSAAQEEAQAPASTGGSAAPSRTSGSTS